MIISLIITNNTNNDNYDNYFYIELLLLLLVVLLEFVLIVEFLIRLLRSNNILFNLLSVTLSTLLEFCNFIFNLNISASSCFNLTSSCFIMTDQADSSLRYKRILLKLSGEALMGDRPYGIDLATIEKLIKFMQQFEQTSV